MKHTGFRYEISARLTFTTADLILLLHASRNHYDRACKDLSARFGSYSDYTVPDRSISQLILCNLREGEDKGDGEDEVRFSGDYTDEKQVATFLFEHPNATATMELKFRTIDTMAKAMEHYSWGAGVVKVLNAVGATGAAGRAVLEAVLAAPLQEQLGDALKAINARVNELKAQDEAVGAVP